MPEDKTPSRKPAVKKSAGATKKPPAAAQAPAPTKPVPRSGTAAKSATATPPAPVAKKVATATKTSKATDAGKPAAARTGAGATRKASPAKVVARPAAPPAAERQRWIAIAAYHRAEQRGFTPGYELQDWLEAEAEIGDLIGKG
jgi:hypothetical protein